MSRPALRLNSVENHITIGTWVCSRGAMK